MPQPETERPLPPQVETSCPECSSELALLRIIEGRATEYWTMRCTHCGAIHMSIVDIGAQARA